MKEIMMLVERFGLTAGLLIWVLYLHFTWIKDNHAVMVETKNLLVVIADRLKGSEAA